MQDSATCSNDASENVHQQLPSKFIQQLLSHVDQLNALCQNQIYHERPQASINPLSSQNYGHVPNTCKFFPLSRVLSIYSEFLLK